MSLPVQLNFDAFRTVADDSVEYAYSTELAEIERFFDPDFIDVDQGLLEGSASIIVHEDNAEDLDLGVGSTVTLEFVDQVERDFTVAAIYGDLAIFDSGWILPASFWDENPNLPEQQDAYVTMLTANGVSEDAARAAIEEVTNDFPQLDAFTKAEFQDDQEASINQVLVIVNVLLFISVALALLGIAITLALSVFERTREFGLTRAVGGTRRQMKRTVRVEGIIVAVFGGLLGIALGLVFGIACVQDHPGRLRQHAGDPLRHDRVQPGHRRCRGPDRRVLPRSASVEAQRARRHRSRRLTKTTEGGSTPPGDPPSGSLSSRNRNACSGAATPEAPCRSSSLVAGEDRESSAAQQALRCE